MKRTHKIKGLKSESIMQVKKMNQNKNNRKSKWNNQFKGKCFNCGEPGAENQDIKHQNGLN